MPLDHQPTSPIRGAATRVAGSAIEIAAIGRSTAIIGWLQRSDEPPRRGFRALTDGRSVPPPAAHCMVSTAEHRRHLLAVPVAATSLFETRIDVSALDGAVVAAAEPAGRVVQRPTSLDLLALSAELAAAERVRLLRFLLEVCPTLLKLGRDPSFIDLAHDLVGALAERPGPLASRCTAGPLVLLEAAARRGIGTRLTGIAVGRSGVVRLATPPAELPHPKPAASLARLAVAVDRDLAVSGGTLVILGEGGIACRRLPTELPPLTAFERARSERGFDAPLRNFLVDALIGTEGPGASLAPLVHELRAATSALAPRPATGVVRGGIDLAVANRGGMLIAGWLDDPHDLIDAITLLRRDRFVHVDRAALLRFRHAQADRAGREASGFLCRTPVAADGDLPASIQISARLRSGASIALGEGPSILPPAMLLPRMLAAVATAPLDPRMLAALLHPIAEPVAAEQAVPCALELLKFGAAPTRLQTSLLAPVADDPDLLRARFASFALDRGLDDVDLVHVVDDPRRGAAVAAALRGLSDLYGRGTRLAIARHPTRMRCALNAAAAMAEAPFLAVLAEDALPEAPGWRAALAYALDANPRAGLVAARLLDADDSLVDAGFMRELDPSGRSRLAARLSGFPRGCADGAPAATVDAVSGGAWLMRRSLFELIGGLSADTLTEFGAESDFCRRITAAGFEIRQLAAPVFHRLGAGLSAPADEIAREIDQLILVSRLAAPASPTRLSTASDDEAAVPTELEALADDTAKKPKRRSRRSRRAA